jgi:hypothetical protein
MISQEALKFQRFGCRTGTEILFGAFSDMILTDMGRGLQDR